MAKPADEISEQEKQTRNEMLFTRSDRDRGTLAMAITPNAWKRKEIYRFLKEHLDEYSFFDLDLTSHTYTSLNRALQELLPKSILESEPVQYLVNITGLESSLYKTEDGKIEFSSLVAQLNFERELIFNQPYIILLWISEGFDKELQKKAPDLMHWMSKRFVFEENGPDGMEVAEAAIEYGTVRKKGKIPERLDRIRQLEETWEKLCLHNVDKARLIKDKINLLRLLGKEYAAAFEFQKAEEAFQKALALNAKIKADLDGELLFEIGDFYYDFNRFELALKYFQKSLEWAKKYGRPDIGNVYHMIGMVYQHQRQMKKALQSYRQALEWSEKENSGYYFGSTYHQIGMVYEKQRKWEDSLRYFRLALDWKEKTGNDYELGSTYHQIGRVYEEQRKWDEALRYYQLALDSNKKVGNEYALGGAYHQMGMVYEEQQMWEESLKYYQLALETYKEAGNEYGLGGTYQQVGRVEEKLGEYGSALAYFEKAVENALQYNHPELALAQRSLDRIRQKIKDQQRPANSPPQA
jgi:tetratricopeptide (TPR) repeat protein